MLSTPQSKPFSRSLHDENDGPAKDAVWRFLFREWELDVQEGTTYGVDLVCYRDGELAGCVEVERRHNDLEKFNTIHVPYRKKKFFESPNKTLLFAVTQNLTDAYWALGSTILQSPVEEKVNKYMKSEKFFVVPKRDWRKVRL